MKYKYYDIYKVLSNLCDLYEDGFTIYHGLFLLEDITLTKKYKKSLTSIKKFVSEGCSVGFSLKKTKIYPDFLCQIVEAGEERGSIEKAFKALSSYYYQKHTIRSKIKSAMYYPCTIIFIALMLSIGFLFFIFPLLYQNFASLNSSTNEFIDLIYSLIMYVKSTPLINIIMIVSLFIAIIFLFFWCLFKIGIIKSIFSFTKLGKRYIEYKFVLLFQIVLAYGGNISDLIKMNIDYHSIGVTKKDINYLVEGLKDGKQVSDILVNFKFISMYTLSMIKLGESRGKLSDSLIRIVNVLDKKINTRMNKITSIVGPLLICIITAVIILIVIFFVAPMLNFMDIGNNL